MQKMSDPPLKKCPTCGGSLAKVMSSTSFVLKGTGWYATDYAKKGNGSGNGKRTDLKNRMKDTDAKKDAPSTDKAVEKSSDTGPEKTSNSGAEKAVKSGSED
jgi:predicted nucleic acid-binding Zn ribbon protein